jgi:hypothetical protein
MFLATGKQQYKIDAHNYAFLPDTRALYGAHKFYSVWPSWDNGWFETAAIMINMGQDTKDKAMEKHLRAMLASWIEGWWCAPKGGRCSSPGVQIGTWQMRLV